MVIYDLQCPSGHAFEGWFRSADDFAAQARDGRLACPVCAAPGVVRLPSASRVNRGVPKPEGCATPAGPRSADDAPRTDPRALARAVHRFVARHFEDVGRGFAREARRMHEGEIAERPIRGQATASEARSLHEDGIAALPVPFADPDKLN